jgi:hypothetical protein
MLHLNKIDLVIIDSINVSQAIETLRICTQNIKFGNVYLFSHEQQDDSFYKTIIIDEITSIEQYSDFCLKLCNYVNNDYILLVQNDGFIINYNLWDEDFLNYDYIGAPWNLTMVPNHRVGNGGFSLRSKKFLDFSNKFDSTDGIPEDNFLCIYNHHLAVENGIKFAPTKLASKFAHEFHNPYATEFNPSNHFGFHGKENVDQAKKFILKKQTQSIEV